MLTVIIDIESVINDVDKCVAYIGDKMAEILYDVVGIYQQEWVNIGSGRDCYDRVLYTYNLTQVNDRYYSDVNRVDIVAYWVSVYRHAYHYGNGYDISNLNDIDEFLQLAERCLLLNRMTIAGISTRVQTRWAEIDRLQEISLNYGIAVAKVQARHSFTAAVKHAKTSDQTAYTTPKILAILADITQGYAIQLIVAGTIPATKNKGSWAIDVLAALTWLQGRDDCYDWILRL